MRTQSGQISFSGTTAYFFTSQGAIAPPDAGTVPVNVLVVEIHESAEGCGAWTGVSPPTRSVLSITVMKQDPSPVTPERYPVSEILGPDRAAVLYAHQEAAGGILLRGFDGKVDLARLSDTSAQGSVDVTIQGGTRMQGEFSAAPCP